MKAELYDRSETVPDSYNLAADSSYTSVTGEMKSELEEWINSFIRH